MAERPMWPRGLAAGCSRRAVSPILNFLAVASAARSVQVVTRPGRDKPMTTLPITLTIAGAAALMNLWLGLRVSMLRRRHKVSIGDGGNDAVRTRMRAHANFAEYTPIFLILLGL